MYQTCVPAVGHGRGGHTLKKSMSKIEFNDKNNNTITKNRKTLKSQSSHRDYSSIILAHEGAGKFVIDEYADKKSNVAGGAEIGALRIRECS